MEPHQELSVFLPELKAGLIKNGMTEFEADFVYLSVAKRARSRKITSIREYQDAWLVCHTMEDILTTLDDGSEAAGFAHCSGKWSLITTTPTTLSLAIGLSTPPLLK